MSLADWFAESVDEALGPVASVATPTTADATTFPFQKQSGSVSSEGSVQKHLSETSGCTLPQLTAADEEAIRESIAERAAVREFDAGESREVAERQARSAMRVYRFRLTDQPKAWLTMLAPECNPTEARHALELRFGPERVIEIREQTR